MSDAALHAYARRLERELAPLDERPIVLSPREWGCIADWHARGIPVELVIEALHERLVRRSKKATGRPKLGSLREAVEESWSVIAADRSLRH